MAPGLAGSGSTRWREELQEKQAVISKLFLSGVIEGGDSIGSFEGRAGGGARLLAQTIIASWPQQLSLHHYPRQPLPDTPAGDSGSDLLRQMTGIQPHSPRLHAPLDENANVITVALGPLQ